MKPRYLINALTFSTISFLTGLNQFLCPALDYLHIIEGGIDIDVTDDTNDRYKQVRVTAENWGYDDHYITLRFEKFGRDWQCIGGGLKFVMKPDRPDDLDFTFKTSGQYGCLTLGEVSCNNDATKDVFKMALSRRAEIAEQQLIIGSFS